jgi:hypothetical protein
MYSALLVEIKTHYYTVFFSFLLLVFRNKCSPVYSLKTVVHTPQVPGCVGD